MTKSDATQNLALACEAVARHAPRKSRMQRMRGRLGQCAAGISTCALGITVAAMAVAQQNIYEKPTKGGFQAAPKSAEAEAAEAAAAAESGNFDVILGVHVNTIFFVAAGVIAVVWFTRGGGRKAKVSRHG